MSRTNFKPFFWEKVKNLSSMFPLLNFLRECWCFGYGYSSESQRWSTKYPQYTAFLVFFVCFFFFQRKKKKQPRKEFLLFGRQTSYQEQWLNRNPTSRNHRYTWSSRCDIFSLQDSLICDSCSLVSVSFFSRVSLWNKLHLFQNLLQNCLNYHNYSTTL